VVHLAWCASGDAGYRTSADNDRWVTAGVELRDACRATGARLWATGTVVDRETDPQDAYTASKAALRRLLAADIDSGEIGWLRPSYVFDEVGRRPALLAHALAAHDRGESAELRTPGSVHDFVHVTDVARAVLTAVAADCRGEVAIGSGRVRSVAALVEALGVAWHPSPTAPAAGSTQAGTAADISRLTDVGWTPRRTEELFGHE
jgi:nucleoside-diphosphate-sugar epimerase